MPGCERDLVLVVAEVSKSMKYLQDSPTARVLECKSKPKNKWRPLPLDTVELEKQVCARSVEVEQQTRPGQPQTEDDGKRDDDCGGEALHGWADLISKVLFPFALQPEAWLSR